MKRSGDTTSQPKLRRKGAQRLSRKKKKYWRRGTNLVDVEEGLETERTEAQLGGSLSKKADKDLFVIHASPSSSGIRSKSSGGLRCFRSLEPNSLVPPAKVSVPVAFKKKPLKKKLLSRRRTRKLRSRGLERIELDSDDLEFKGKAICDHDSNVVPSSSRCEIVGLYDLWGSSKNKDGGTKSIESSVDPTAVLHIRNQGRSWAIKPPVTYGVRPSDLSSVEVAHPGASYNPSYSDYQELMEDAAQAEVKKIHEEEKIERSLALPDPEERATPGTYMHEMTEGLFNDDDDDDDNEESSEAGSIDETKQWRSPLAGEAGVGTVIDDQASGAEDDEEEYRAPNVPTSSVRRKSKAQRRREAEAEAARVTIEKEKKERKCLNAVYSIKRLNAEIREKEALTERRKLHRTLRKALRTRIGPGKHSKHGFSAPDKEISLPEELEGCLRLLTPEGNLLEDRFKSLQKRNVLETRIRQKRVRKYKRKKYETRSHRGITLDHKVI